ncbi:MAG TPA: polysaccharide biosynthesis tyrosine autokinase [Flavobacteriales bacterium]|nr:polysaccharide biosynthesis tyrosine autokinase [Flavobacteriales bacterium]HNE80242.1 polysaccharide biosynthesis tyrosine autokinase [Flavobacteriales bacterium]HNI05607.1 polysaccharide biosynthesis tyrosine autokinase [Flavobacteriales bacterium]HNK40478.1 polysaccharide biosynthesis tyrosine autokinase [Flavobacteriales bacterium]HNM68927.1 polysaccharide biosynthesis tyrosine autokinase [Flavobacteriales bacterium]
MSHSGPQDTIDLKAIFARMVGKWWLFAISIAIALAAGVAYIKTTPKSYRVKAVLRMSEGRRSSFGGQKEEFLRGASYLKTDAELEDEITMIRSVSNMTATLRKLDFTIGYFVKENFLTKEEYGTAPYVVHMDTSSLQICGLAVHVKVDTLAGTWRVSAAGKNVHLYDLRTEKVDDGFLPKVEIDELVALGQPFKSKYLSFNIELLPGRAMKAGSEYFFFLNPMDEQLRQWQGITEVSPMSDESNIVILTTGGEVISKQERFLDMLMATYIQSEQDKNTQKGKATIEFIDATLAQSDQRLRQAQTQLQIAQSGGSMGDAASQSGAINQELFRLQDEEGRIRSKLSNLNALVATMSGDMAGQASTIAATGLDAPSLNNLIDKYNQDVQQLRTNELNVKIATAPIIALRRTVQTERDQIVQSAQALVHQTQSELGALQSRISVLQGKLYVLPQQDAQRRIATKSYELTEGIHNYLMEKSYEAQIAVNSDQVDKSVVDSARPDPPSPIAPDKKVVLGGAFAIGFIIPLLLLMLMDLVNDKIGGLDELKRLTAIPILATIPSSKRKRITPDEPKSLLAESFRTARINLQYLNANAPRQVVGMTSSTSGEGKTFCSINLATVITLSGKRTLLIDADMRRPRVHEYLELPDGPGLSTLLIGECTVEQAIRRSGIQGLDVITAGPIPPNPLELVESPRMAELFAKARERYDHIVVDASPMGLVSEFKIIMGHVDVILYVVRQGHTRRPMLRNVNELYHDGKLPHANMILNDVKAGEGYGEGYGYYTK